MNVTLGHDQRFEFEGDQNLIRLDIPPEGITTNDEAWRITALGPSVVGLAVPLPLHTPTVLIEKMGDTPLLYNFCVSACVG